MEKMYFKMYESASDTHSRSVVIRPEEMNAEIESAKNNDVDMPVFEPVFMTEEEFNDIPEFDGF